MNNKLENNKEKTYWPHMILGFLLIGFTLGYWTVKDAVQMPVQEVNQYMLKYQNADRNINEILESQKMFDKKYRIKIVGAETTMLEIANSKRAKEEEVVLLHLGKNLLSYRVQQKDGSVVHDAKVSFLLTRPHTRKEDILIEDVNLTDGKYIIDTVNLTKAGRYTLQLRVTIGKATGYSELPAYVKL